MMMRVKADMLVCVDCLTFTANGVVLNECGDDVTHEHGERMVSHMGDDAGDLAHMVLGGEHRGFFGEDSTCDGCGSNDAGDRYTAHILEAVPGR